MKARIRNPAANTDKPSVIQYETSIARIIKYHNTKYGISVFATCHKLRRISGLAYFASGSGTIPSYTPLVFSFKLYEIQRQDQDADGIPSYLEDLNGDGVITVMRIEDKNIFDY